MVGPEGLQDTFVFLPDWAKAVVGLILLLRGPQSLKWAYCKAEEKFSKEGTNGTRRRNFSTSSAIENMVVPELQNLHERITEIENKREQALQREHDQNTVMISAMQELTSELHTLSSVQMAIGKKFDRNNEWLAVLAHTLKMDRPQYPTDGA